MTEDKFNAIFERLSAAVEARLSGASGCHDFDHTRRVLHNAEMMLEALPAADRRVVLVAALLHDIARPEEMAAKGALCHAEAGAGAVPEMLAPFDLPPEFVAHVAACVRTHRYRDGLRPATLEAEIVYDADKLDSLGATGIGRAFLFAGRENARLHNTEAEALGSPAYSREDTAYREYLVKLRHLPAAMLTGPGLEMALERARFMADFFERLNREDFSGNNATRS